MAEETQPYINYNKQDDVPTLVGNWVEERHLKDMTGITRNMASSQVLNDTSSSGSPARARGDALQATHPRVIEHVQAQTHPADWRSTHNTSFMSPGQQTQSNIYVDTSKMGPRERMMHEAMMAEARDLPPELAATVLGGSVPMTMESTYGGDFKGHDLTGMTIGARVMQDLDGRPVQRDPTFLAESEIMVKHQVDRIMGDTARKFGAQDTAVLANPDVPVTIYTEAVAKKTYGGVFPGTATLNGGSPFGKSTNFSKPMSDYSKVVIDE